MGCTRPVPYFLSNSGGRPKFIKKGFERYMSRTDGRVVFLPCGSCHACRRERRQDYTTLQQLESLEYDDNWFVTLTYDEEHLPVDGSLHREHLSAFFESLRHYCVGKGLPCRYFACGEYGDRYQRPHYHFSLFGMSPESLGLRVDDSESFRLEGLNRGRIHKIKEGVYDENGNRYWHSPVIGARWTKGAHKIYRANRQTFQYIAGYVSKKLFGSALLAFKQTGRIPPFCLQSRPSIGYSWWKKHYKRLSVPSTSGRDEESSTLVNDEIVAPDVNWRIPRICMRWLQRVDPVRFELVHTIRLKNIPARPDREEQLRKHLYDEHRALRMKQNIKHKEIK